ncbi:MAG TPA: tyrosine-type recombinase/integrase [Ktedonobacteraceae bacterium]
METRSFRLVDGTSALISLSPFEAEFAKDRWDAHNIPGLRYAAHSSHYHILFTVVPASWRPFIKEYAKYLIAADRTVETIDIRVRQLGHFLQFFLQRYPGVTGLRELSTQDIDDFTAWIRADVQLRKLKNSNTHVNSHIQALAGWLSYLERTDHLIKPLLPLPRLIWPHHYPPLDHKSASNNIKYIPRSVLGQLDQFLHQLTAVYIPVMLLLRASGWRISDVLALKWMNCLEQDNEKYCLVGDIQKTRVLGHRIPISQEVAAVIQAQIVWVKQHYSAQENPHGWLFPASKTLLQGRSPRFLAGDPLSANGIRDRLNHLAKTCQIQDEQGRLFHFRLHAFRHTKAVELINNGMSLVLVQQWMAHASPEMTLIYAKILDETMRTAWEKTVQQGIVQFHDGKPEFVSEKKLLPMAGANAFDPERVREHRQNVKMALGSCLKTAKIVCKFVELPCFHCPAYVLTPDDLPSLEAYAQQILERIEIGKQAGNAHWIEVNQKNLDERVRPAIALLKQGQVVAKTDKCEREYSDEEWEQRQPHNQESQA